jgi:hypothetical protein
VVLIADAFSQKLVTHSTQQWLQYNNQTKIADRWFFGLDGGFRWKDGSRFQYIGRAGFNYQFNPRIKVGVGVARTGIYKSDKISKLEFRPYQEVLAIISDNRISIRSRFRLEERIFNNRSEVPAHNYNFRFRYMLSFNIPIVQSQHFPSRKLSLVVSDEIFLNAGHNIVYNVLDRNRVLIGPAWQMSKALAFGISYMYQFAPKDSPAAYDSDDIIWVTLRQYLNLVRKKSD